MSTTPRSGGAFTLSGRTEAKRTWANCRMVAAGAAGVTMLAAAAPPAEALTIFPTYDTSVTARSDSNQIMTAFAFAAQQFQNKYSDPISINITVSASASVNLGQSSFNLVGVTNNYAGVRAALIADQKTTNDASANLSLGATDPTGGGTFLVTTAQAKALGLPSGGGTNDGTFTFNSNQAYTFDSANRAVSGKQDFIGVAEHEISEILGRGFLLGKNLSGAPDYEIFDLFRFTAPGTRSLTSNVTTNGAAIYFSIDNGATNLKTYNSDPTGDLQDWANTGPDAYNAFGTTGLQNDITPVDLQTLDVIGYDLVVPEPATLGLLAAPGAYFLARRRRPSPAPIPPASSAGG